MLHDLVESKRLQIQAQAFEEFKTTQATRAKQIAAVLSFEVLESLNIRLTQTGEFTFEWNARSYKFNVLAVARQQIEVSVARSYYACALFQDADLIQFLAEETDRQTYSPEPSQLGDLDAFPIAEDQSSGMSLRHYFIGQAISAGRQSDDAISITDQTLDRLQQQQESLPTPMTYPFQLVLSWGNVHASNTASTSVGC